MLHASNAAGTGLIPGQGTKIPHAPRHSQRKKKDCQVVTCLHTHQQDGGGGVSITVPPPHPANSDSAQRLFHL